MFRSVIGRIVASAAGVQVCAAGVALTDKQLSKKPDWYQKDVHALEDSLKKLGRHGFNTSPSTVNESYETLKKYAHISNVEIHWRMARALLEKSYFTKCPTERAHLVHEAKDCAKKALTLESDTPSAGAHKWYAIVLANVEELDSKADHSAEIVKHLEKAAELDADDAYTVHMLGVAHYKRKNYAEALACFQKAENIRSHFSTRNLYYMGMAHHSSGHKEEAIKCFAGYALKRLMTEYKELTNRPPEGILAAPLEEDNFFEWECLITGPEDTCFANGVFPARISFPQDYPLSPPKMRFTCDLFHPNIYQDGRVCISILHAPGDDPTGYESSSERWSPVQSIEKILLSVVSMLAEPNDESPANVNAAKMWREDRQQFEKIADNLVRKTLCLPLSES